MIEQMPEIETALWNILISVELLSRFLFLRALFCVPTTGRENALLQYTNFEGRHLLH